MAADHIRAFIALPMPEEVQRYLYALQRRLENAAPHAVRWVGAEGMHLTLKFFAEMPVVHVPSVSALVLQAAAAAGPLRLPLTTVGCFPSPLRPRIIWVGLGGDVSRLGDLQQAVDAGAAALGFDVETRPFAPHITLGRVRDTVPPDDLGLLRRMLQAPPALSGAPSALVDRLILYQSTLTQTGPVYRHLIEAPLSAT